MTMIKKDYMKSKMNVVKILQTQLICASLTDVKVLGLDEEEELELPGEGLPKTGSVWDDAW